MLAVAAVADAAACQCTDSKWHLSTFCRYEMTRNAAAALFHPVSAPTPHLARIWLHQHVLSAWQAVSVQHWAGLTVPCVPALETVMLGCTACFVSYATYVLQHGAAMKCQRLACLFAGSAARTSRTSPRCWGLCCSALSRSTELRCCCLLWCISTASAAGSLARAEKTTARCWMLCDSGLPCAALHGAPLC